MPYWMLRKYPWHNFILLYKFILLVYNKRGGGSKEGGGIVWNKKVGRMFDNFSKTNKRGEGPHLFETREIKCNLSQIYIPYRIRYIKIRTSLNNFGLTSTATKNLLLRLTFSVTSSSDSSSPNVKRQEKNKKSNIICFIDFIPSSPSRQALSNVKIAKFCSA